MDMPTFIEYIKLHLLSIEQDSVKLENLMDNFKGDYDSDSYRELEMEDVINTGEMRATMHLLAVAEGRV